MRRHLDAAFRPVRTALLRTVLPPRPGRPDRSDEGEPRVHRQLPVGRDLACAQRRLGHGLNPPKNWQARSRPPRTAPPPLALAAGRRRQHPRAAIRPERLERPRQRIDQPQMCHSVPGMGRALLGEVEAPRRQTSQTQSGARAIYATAAIDGSRSRRHPGQVRYQHVRSVMQLRLGEDPPAARSAAPLLERTLDASSERQRRIGMARMRPRMQGQRPVHDLGHPVRGSVDHVLIGGGPGLRPGRLVHRVPRGSGPQDTRPGGFRQPARKTTYVLRPGSAPRWSWLLRCLCRAVQGDPCRNPGREPLTKSLPKPRSLPAGAGFGAG